VAVPSGVLLGATVPQPGEHALPFCVSVHVTFPLLASLLTVPLSCSELPACTFAEVCDNETEIAGTVITAVIDLESAIAVAVRFTFKSLAGGPGAV
jgi:hypothetical protein